MFRDAASRTRSGALAQSRALAARPLRHGDPLAEILRSPSTPNRQLAIATSRLIDEALRGSAAALFERLRKEEAGPELPITVPGSRTLTLPLRICVCVDESGSVASTDPGGEAPRATLLACEWLDEYSENPRDRIGLVRFAERADSISPARAGSARGVIELALAHGGHDLGGGTQLAPAITEIRRMLGGHLREYRLALLVTDGQVAESDEELRRLFGRLRASLDSVYLIALDADGAWSSQTHHRYESLGLSGVIPLQKAGGGELAAAIASVLVHEAGLAVVHAEGSGRRR
jgi:hypothetical protein